MNKIDIDTKKIILHGDVSYLNIDQKTKLEINIPENMHHKLFIIGTSDYAINYHLLENSSLSVDSLNKDNKANIDINLNKGSTILYNHSVLSHNDSENVFNINHLASDTTSILNNNGVNMNNNKLFFTINGIIPKELININCNQSSKIINFQKGNSKIIPNLIIDSNDITANHSAYIGEINEEELFYLSSRGIKKEEIKKMIYQTTLLGKMEKSEELERKINEWW